MKPARKIERIMDRCGKCGNATPYTIRSMCPACNKKQPEEPYAYLGGMCVECGATDGLHRVFCEAVS